MTEQLNMHLNTSYQLPDGHVIKIGSERFRCPEAVFSFEEYYLEILNTYCDGFELKNSDQEK
ncbi:actin [Trichinella murrelli]|uniref:Actin n=1 Tax=Trichinella murrelli TaxID=144512 RepID=A0A0V0TMA1_9BILA|nr:actin [Trichinella murrelli]